VGRQVSPAQTALFQPRTHGAAAPTRVRGGNTEHWRVLQGFEWNKYNQTHYDGDNPPPKVVQGYKFNIFYPDLINRFETPEYIIVCLRGFFFVLICQN
jgi:hypothetical protein